MGRRSRAYDIQCAVSAQVGSAEPIELGSAAVEWPYDTSAAMSELLRRIADEIDRQRSARRSTWQR
jgi:hypothetical protein